MRLCSLRNTAGGLFYFFFQDCENVGIVKSKQAFAIHQNKTHSVKVGKQRSHSTVLISHETIKPGVFQQLSETVRLYTG